METAWAVNESSAGAPAPHSSTSAPSLHVSGMPAALLRLLGRTKPPLPPELKPASYEAMDICVESLPSEHITNARQAHNSSCDLLQQRRLGISGDAQGGNVSAPSPRKLPRVAEPISHVDPALKALTSIAKGSASSSAAPTTEHTSPTSAEAQGSSSPARSSSNPQILPGAEAPQHGATAAAGQAHGGRCPHPAAAAALLPARPSPPSAGQRRHLAPLPPPPQLPPPALPSTCSDTASAFPAPAFGGLAHKPGRCRGARSSSGTCSGSGSDSGSDWDSDGEPEWLIGGTRLRVRSSAPAAAGSAAAPFTSSCGGRKQPRSPLCDPTQQLVAESLSAGLRLGSSVPVPGGTACGLACSDAAGGDGGVGGVLSPARMRASSRQRSVGLTRKRLLT